MTAPTWIPTDTPVLLLPTHLFEAWGANLECSVKEPGRFMWILNPEWLVRTLRSAP